MKASEKGPIALSKHFLTSLSDQIPNIQNFKGKWAIIKSKITNLEIQLFDFKDFPASTSNSLSIELVFSVSKTLNDVVSLAQKCQRADLAEGKLKTQREIDSVLAKLDGHTKDIDILIRSGVLQDGVVSNSSRKEAVRAEASNLVTRLQIGATESKNSSDQIGISPTLPSPPSSTSPPPPSTVPPSFLSSVPTQAQFPSIPAI